MLNKLHQGISNRSNLYRKWHEFRFHPHIHWGIFGTYSLVTTLKVLALILSIGIVSYPLTTYASTQTWDNQSDWGNWTKSQTSSSITSGSLTLSTANQSWTAQTSGVTTELKDIKCVDANTCYSAGSTGTDGILKTTNGGSSWSVLPSIDYGEPIDGVSFIDANTGWIISYSGSLGFNIYKTSNGGTSWTKQADDDDYFAGGCAVPLNELCRGYDIHMVSSTNGWAVTQGLNNPPSVWNSKILTTTNGSTWTLQNSGVNQPLYGIYGVSTTTAWAVGGNGSILKTTDGSSWSAQSSGTSSNLWSVYFIDANTGWATGDGGTVLTTTNGGSTWSAQTSGTASTLFSVYFLNANNGWIAGASGTVLTTTNGGSTWSAQTSGTAQNLYEIFMLSTSSGFTAGGNGTILKYSSTYQTPGYASISFDGTNTYNNWQTLTKSETTNSQTIAYYAKTSADSSCSGDGAPWTGWSALSFSGESASLSALSHTRYLCLGVNLSTSDSAVTPQVDELRLTYVADSAPTVSISTPATNTCPAGSSKYYTASASQALTGTATDDTSVASVSSSPSSTVTGTTSWSTSAVSLTADADTPVTMTATDGVGQTGNASRTIFRDTLDPTVTISSPTSSPTYETTSSTVTLGGSSSDAGSGVSSLSSSAGTASGTTSWEVPSISLSPGDNTITITATDCVGHTSTDSITVTYDTPPTITITSPSTDAEFTTTSSSVTLSGSSADSVGTITSVSSSGLTIAGTTTWSAGTVSLSLGSNVFSVTATDSSGNTATDTITITYATTISDPETPPSDPPSEPPEECNLAAPTIQECGDSWGGILVTSPNGGEAYNIGEGTDKVTTHDITWTVTEGTYFPASFTIQYSTDSGSNWTDIVTEVSASERSYTWTLPTTVASTYKVKVIGVDANSVSATSDTSDADFMIFSNSKPEISPVSP